VNGAGSAGCGFIELPPKLVAAETQQSSELLASDTPARRSWLMIVSHMKKQSNISVANCFNLRQARIHAEVVYNQSLAGCFVLGRTENFKGQRMHRVAMHPLLPAGASRLFRLRVSLSGLDDV